METDKAGINPAFRVRRSLKLTGLTADNAERAATDIRGIPGVEAVQLNPAQNSLVVAYDGSQTGMNALLQTLKAHGIAPATHWWNRIKLDWARQIDQNIYDNARHEPHCCGKPPRGH